jgi:superfamily II DNA or RNA helicase
MHPYQEDITRRVLAEYAAGYRRVVEQMPTGAGKTYTVAQAQIPHFLRQGFKVLFVVDLDFVVDDTAAILISLGIDAGVIQAGKPYVADKAVYVCSLMTLIKRGLRPFADERVIFILDECHIFAGPECLALLHAYPEALHLGLTATPQRGDGTALGNFYERIVCGPQMSWLMQNGFLVPKITTYAPGKKQKKLAWDPVESWFRYAPGLRSLYFCASSDHAEKTAARFNELGVGAEVVTSKTGAKARRGFRERVKKYQTLVVCTHSVGIKALDLPEIACVGIWRSVSVQGVYQQMGGRGARRGKEEMIFIDGVGNCRELGLLQEDRTYSLDGDPIKLAHTRPGSLTTCRECGAVQAATGVCVRCGGELVPEEVKVSAANKMVEVKAVPLDARQDGLLRKLIHRGLQFVVPAMQRRQAAKKARGEQIGRPIGGWFAVEWALAEFRKTGMQPLPEVVKGLKREFEGR